MEKREYEIPKIEMIFIETEGIMAGSDDFTGGGNPNPGGGDKTATFRTDWDKSFTSNQ